MEKLKISKYYAKGLLNSAFDKKKDDVVYSDMKKLSFILSKSCDLQFFLRNPLINYKKKKEISKKLFKSLSKISQRFIELLIFHNREFLLYLISIEYQKIYLISKNIVNIIITTVIPLDKILEKQIIEKITCIFGSNKKYQIFNKINPDIIGGFILCVGDKELDSSINGKLNQIQKKILNYNYF